MSDKEKVILEKLSNTIGTWADTQKEYLLGYIEGLAQANKGKRKKTKDKK